MKTINIVSLALFLFHLTNYSHIRGLLKGFVFVRARVLIDSPRCVCFPVVMAARRQRYPAKAAKLSRRLQGEQNQIQMIAAERQGKPLEAPKKKKSASTTFFSMAAC